MKKRSLINILIGGLFVFLPTISQAILAPNQQPVLNSAVINTDVYGNPQSVEITATFYDECTYWMSDQVKQMDNTVLVQVFVETISPFCAPAETQFTHVVNIDAIPEGSSITVGLYNGTAAQQGVVEIYGDPVVIQPTSGEETPSEGILVDIKPSTLNLKSKGKFVTASVELPKEYAGENMALESAIMEGSVHAEKISLTDGIFNAKFSRKKLIDLLSTRGMDFPANVELKLELNFSGEKTDLSVEAKDIVRIQN